ncbi:TcfC E-set like domain-containing protein [Photobacterium leiognathi]|uniref:TcfC E-set like domain-containing protein n=1 Tax=Photobacterium leiognathi TaxID=553611 RepID=UPI002982B185|nr:TcfC E-set like domain-containing protein [Photobacterium leiognathi]
MKRKLFVALCLKFISSYVIAEEAMYPQEFADFFDVRNEEIEVIIVGASNGTYLRADVSYDTFKLTDNQIYTGKLQNYLENQNITGKFSKQITDLLSAGVDANPGCKTTLALCIPKDNPDSPEFVFDFDNKLLKIFASSEMFDTFSGKVEYFIPTKENNALINTSNLYAYVSDTYYNTSWANESTIGLPYGNFDIKTRIQNGSNESSFELNRALYNYELDSNRLVVGYQDEHMLSFNSTDFLSYGSNYAGYMATIGSSNNLIKGSKSAQKKVNFYSSQGGQLEVYNGGTLLLSKVVSPGEQFIGYNEIPSGVYTITLKLKQGNNVILEENRLIVNNSTFSLPIDHIDYRFDVGTLESPSTSNRSENLVYIRALTSYRPYESFLVGSSLVSSGNDNQFLIGANYVFNDSINFQYNVGLSSNDDKYQQGNVNISNFNFGLRKFEHKNLDKISRLSHALYGDSNFNEYSAGFSSDLLNGQSYINYFRYETEKNDSNSKSDNLSLTYTTSFMSGDLSLNATYTVSDNTDSIYSGITWRKQFGNGKNGQFGVTFEDNNYANSHSRLSKNFSYDEFNGSLAAGINDSIDGFSSELSASLYGNNDYLRYDSYGYIDSVGNRSLSGSLSGTQIITLDEILFTNQKGDAFINLSPIWKEKGTNKLATIDYNIHKNNDFWLSEAVNVGKSKVVSIPLYNKLDIDIDVKYGNVDNEYENESLYITSGKYYDVNNSLTPLKSSIFVLNDINGNPVKNVRCLGESCKSVEELTNDGVFRINYAENEPFKLVSEKRLCVYSELTRNQKFIEAVCLPGIDDEREGVNINDISELREINDKQLLIYVGKYESNRSTKEILNKLADTNLTVKTVSVDNDLYIYVKYKNSYTVVQRNLLENLDAYVVMDAIDTDQLFTTR